MLQRLAGKWRLWGEALVGMDDPLGEYLLELEERLGRLEGELVRLRRPASANAPATVSISDKVLPPEPNAYLR